MQYRVVCLSLGLHPRCEPQSQGGRIWQLSFCGFCCVKLGLEVFLGSRVSMGMGYGGIRGAAVSRQGCFPGLGVGGNGAEVPVLGVYACVYPSSTATFPHPVGGLGLGSFATDKTVGGLSTLVEGVTEYCKYRLRQDDFPIRRRRPRFVFGQAFARGGCWPLPRSSADQQNPELLTHVHYILDMTIIRVVPHQAWHRVARFREHGARDLLGVG